MIVCVYLRQAGEDGGAAGRAAAHRGEGVLKHQAALRQEAKVRGVDHRVVVHLRLEARIIRWKRDNESVSSCAKSLPCLHNFPNRDQARDAYLVERHNVIQTHQGNLTKLSDAAQSLTPFPVGAGVLLLFSNVFIVSSLQTKLVV